MLKAEQEDFNLPIIGQMACLELENNEKNFKCLLFGGVNLSGI